MSKALKIILMFFVGLIPILIAYAVVDILDSSRYSRWENKCINEILEHEEMQDTFAWKVEELEFNDKFDNDIKKMYLITTYTGTESLDVIKVCTWICLVEKGNYIDCDIFNVEYVEEVKE